MHTRGVKRSPGRPNMLFSGDQYLWALDMEVASCDRPYDVASTFLRTVWNTLIPCAFSHSEHVFVS